MVGSTLIGGTSLDQLDQQLASATQEQVVYVDHHTTTKRTNGILDPFNNKIVEVRDIEFTTDSPLSLDDILFIEMDAELELDFDTEVYLPAGFNPYMSGFDVDQIDFVDLSEEEDFGIVGSLPADFDPYAIGNVLTAVNYIEEEDELELGFDTAKYLPVGFNPYKAYDFLDTIEYIEMEEDDINLGFDTLAYLPSDFDPHKKE